MGLLYILSNIAPFLLILWMATVIATIALAIKKGYSGFLAFLLGLFIPLFGSLIIIALLPNKHKLETKTAIVHTNIKTDDHEKEDEEVKETIMYMAIKATPLKYGCSLETDTIKTIENGTEVKFISEMKSGWYCIETLEGKRGFCQSSDLKKI
jgi:uncharacterized protein YgiM (DUF1202 family)